MRSNSCKFWIAIAIPSLAVAALAVVPDADPGRFHQIPQRNVFALKAQEMPVISNAPPQIPKVLLTGITTILGNKRALLKELPLSAPGKPADATKEVSHILTEGQREGEVEVLQIDEKAGSVKVNVAGTVQTLTFEKDGVKLPTTPVPGTTSAPPVVPGSPGMAAVAGAIPPGGTPGGIQPGGIIQSNHATRSLPTRTPRWPMTGTGPTEAAATPEVPSPTGRPAATAAAPAVSGTDTQGLTPEEQRILQQIQQAAQPIPQAPPSAASGTFQTPGQEGMAPAFAVPPPPLPGNPRQILPQ